MSEAREKIEVLKKFFTVSTAGFNFMITTLKTMEQPVPAQIIEMHKLHQWTLDFINGLNLHDDEALSEALKKLDSQLARMEELAAHPLPTPTHEKGGIPFGDKNLN